MDLLCNTWYLCLFAVTDIALDGASSLDCAKKVWCLHFNCSFLSPDERTPSEMRRQCYWMTLFTWARSPQRTCFSIYSQSPCLMTLLIPVAAISWFLFPLRFLTHWLGHGVIDGFVGDVVVVSGTSSKPHRSCSYYPLLPVVLRWPIMTYEPLKTTTIYTLFT
jgi:hypothetical protein